MGAKQSAYQAPDEGSGQPAGSANAAGSAAPPVGNNKVELAVSVLGGVPGATAYHSSVVVNGEEYFFSDGGVATTRGLGSHSQAQQPPQVFNMGMSRYSGSQLMSAVGRYFQAGTYDLLRKNCNSFSDCALWYLLKKRLEGRYCMLEKVGAANSGLIQSVSNGQYKPNPKALEFDKEKLIAELDPEKVWKTPGHATGGVSVNSAEEMRRKRLEKLGG
eukprot:gnl/MRDRNA2_/MRDRNA2_165335_c0_seq1.p1 gnl/MRDRNA2_/MRDRNA2_165335_c0~~gnl/MRDRNA2_/MRDRNA2_165335_c0_seq1.p1  ORF type:complete len:217 (+),score=46.91 gnl/MRDRNA2_/MRDRNA2_165335_c0_seq1:61-711(+)